MKPLLLVLAGPTASGKTAVACELAKHLPLEAISCDSMQVYRRMPILTQAPPKSFGVGANGRSPLLRTHLVSFLEPSQEYNAAMFRRDASEAIAKILKKKRIPLVTGGTGLYVRALLDGIFEHDEDHGRDEKLRKRLLKEQEKHGAGYLHEALKKVDAPSAAHIHPNDLRRLVRALEVTHVTGRPMSEQRPNRKGLRDDYACRIFFLDRDRADLYQRINTRVDAMVKQGLVTEVKRLRKMKLSQTASMALGYREICTYLDNAVRAHGRAPLQPAVDLLKQHTRNYAKRQLSWFRHEKGVEPVAVGVAETAKTTAQKILRMLK